MDDGIVYRSRGIAIGIGLSDSEAVGMSRSETYSRRLWLEDLIRELSSTQMGLSVLVREDCRIGIVCPGNGYRVFSFRAHSGFQHRYRVD